MSHAISGTSFRVKKLTAAALIAIAGAGALLISSATATPACTGGAIPGVTAISPADGAFINVKPSTVTVQFDRTIGATSSIIVRDAAADNFLGTSSIATTTNPDDTLVFTPSNPNAFSEAASPYTVIAKAAQTSGPTVDCESASTFSLDLTAPTVSIDSPISGGSINATEATSVTLSGTAADTRSGVTSVSVSVSDGSHPAVTGTAPVSGGTWSVALDLSGLDDGTLTFDASTTDGASNTGTATQRTANKDTVAPAAPTVSVPAEISSATETSVTVSGTSEPNASISASLSDGTTTIPASASADGAGAWSVDIDASSLVDGAVTASASATDGAGNTGAAGTASSTKDTTVSVSISSVTDPVNAANASSVAIAGTTDDNTNSVEISISDGTDEVTSAATVAGDGTFTASLDVSTLDDGSLTATATATDGFGNTDSDSATTSKDTSVSVTVDTPDGINSLNETSYTVSGTTDDDTNSVNVTVTDGVDSVTAPAPVASGAWSADLDVSSLADGAVTVSAAATDTASNSATDDGSATKDTFVAVTISSVTNPVNNANQDAVSVSGTTDDDTNSVSVSISDGTATVSGTAAVAAGAWTIDLDASSLIDGTLDVTASVTDTFGNTASDDADTIKDTTFAVTLDGLSVINAANDAAYGVSGSTDDSTNTVSVDATDGSSTVSGNATVAGDGSWTVTLDVSTLNEGTVTVTATATDTASNSAADSDSTTKDTVNTVGLDTPANINQANENSYPVSGSTDDDSNTVSVTVTDGTITATGTASVAPGGAWTATVNTSGLDDGPVTVSAESSDAAGNSDSASMGASKDATIAVSIDGPLDDANELNEGAYEITGTTDDTSNAVEVTVDDGVNPGVTGSATVGPAGEWSVTLDLSGLQDGTLNVEADASDSAGNTAQDTANINKDTGIAVSITSVTDPINQGNVDSVVVSGTTDSDSNTVTVSTGAVSETATISSGAWTATLDVTSIPDGTVTFNATATDSSGNLAGDNADSTKDTTIAVAISSVTDPVNAGNQTSVAVAGTTDDDSNTIDITAGDGSASVSSVATVAAGSWSATLDVSSLSDGALSIAAEASDLAGNSVSDTSATSKDTADPTFVASDPAYSPTAPFTVVGPPVPTIEFTFSEALSSGGDIALVNKLGTPVAGTVSYSPSLETIVFTPSVALSKAGSPYTATASIRDSAGNPVSSPLVIETTFEVNDLPLAVTSYSNPVTGSNETSASVAGTTKPGAAVSVTVSDGSTTTPAQAAAVDSSGNWSATGLDLSSLSDGGITYSATATLLGETTVVNKSAIKESSDPVVTIDPVTSPTANSSPSISFSISDASSISSTSCDVDGAGPAACASPFTPTALTDGSHTIEVSATDSYGNTGSASVSFTVDATDPEVSVDAVASPSANNTPAVNFTTSDATTSVATVECDIDGNGYTACNSGDTHGPLTDGEHTITVRATDQAGNQATDSTTFTIDTTAPEVTVDAVASPTANNTPTVDFTTSDATTSVTTVECDIDGAGFNPCSSGDSHGPLTDGSHTIVVRATDETGNQATDSTTFTVDTTAPEVTVDPVTSPSANNTPEVNFTATDATTSVVATECKVDGGSYNPCSSGDTYGPLADGSHTITVRATDEVGNAAQATTTFIVDTTGPATVISTATNPITAANVAAVAVTGATSEPNSTVTVSIRHTLSPTTVTRTTTSDAAGAWSISGIDVSTVNDGSLRATASASDPLGNAGPAVSRNLLKDTHSNGMISSVPEYVNAANQTVSISGNGERLATVSVVATDGETSVGPLTSTVGSNGRWTVSGLNLSSLADGPVIYTATHVDSVGNTNSDTAGSIKDTVGPEGAIDSPGTQITVIGFLDDVDFTGWASDETTELVSIEATLTNDLLGNTVGTKQVERTPDPTRPNGTTWSVDFTNEFLIPGPHTLTVRMTDRAGNVTLVESSGLIV